MAHTTTHRRLTSHATDAARRIVFVIVVVLALSAIPLSAGTPQQEPQVLHQTCDSVSTVLDRAERTTDSADRQRLLGALRTTASRDCASVLLDALQSTKSSNIQEAATEVLVAVGDERVIGHIENLLRQNPDQGVRGRLAVIIENISAPSAAHSLRQAFANNRDETLRASIPVALGRIGTEESLGQLVDLSAILEEKDWRYVLRGFAAVRNKEALASLRRIFESGASDTVREGVALALGNYEQPDVIVTIESYLRIEPPGRVREALQVSWTRIQKGQ